MRLKGRFAVGRLKKDGSEDQRFKGASRRGALGSGWKLSPEASARISKGCAGIIILAILVLFFAILVLFFGYKLKEIHEELGTTGFIVALVGSVLFLIFWFRWRKSVRAKAKRSQGQEVTSVNKSEGEA